jgi:DNA-3-methyladenine glycosylase
MSKLPYSFYQQDEVVDLAIQLLGKRLYTCIGGEITAGIIVETEAYQGVTDKASHAYGNRFTQRTSTMYEAGGITYVYLCYGIHHLLNVVTGSKNNPHAVLIRAVEPTDGLPLMLTRRNMESLAPRITAGPGSVAKAFGVDRHLNAKDLLGDEIWIEDDGVKVDPSQIVASPRVGVDYAGDHALLPWRFYIKGNRYVSKPNS